MDGRKAEVEQDKISLKRTLSANQELVAPACRRRRRDSSPGRHPVGDTPPLPRALLPRFRIRIVFSGKSCCHPSPASTS